MWKKSFLLFSCCVAACSASADGYGGGTPDAAAEVSVPDAKTDSPSLNDGAIKPDTSVPDVASDSNKPEVLADVGKDTASDVKDTADPVKDTGSTVPPPRTDLLYSDGCNTVDDCLSLGKGYDCCAKSPDFSESYGCGFKSSSLPLCLPVK